MSRYKFTNLQNRTHLTCSGEHGRVAVSGSCVMPAAGWLGGSEGRVGRRGSCTSGGWRGGNTCPDQTAGRWDVDDGEHGDGSAARRTHEALK